MPSTLPLSGARIPLGGEANNAASFMSAFGLDVDPHMVLWASSVSDRDSKYTGAALPAGGLVACAALKTVWLKIATSGSAQWSTVASDTGWVTAGFGYSTGFSSGSMAKIRNVSGVVDCRVNINVTTEITANASTGNVNDTTMATIPTAFIPDTNCFIGGYAVGYTFGVVVNNLGEIRLVSAAPGMTLAVGSVIQTQGTWTV